METTAEFSGRLFERKFSLDRVLGKGATGAFGLEVEALGGQIHSDGSRFLRIVSLSEDWGFAL